MRQNKTPSLRGSVTQNNVTVRMRAREQPGLAGIGFLARLGILTGCILIFLGIFIVLWQIGWPQRQAEKLQETGLVLTQKAQFAVKDIVVEGRQQSSKDDIFDALGTESGAPILDFDAKAAAARLTKLPWVATAVVERRLPDTVVVFLTERIPAARWQHDDHLYVIDTAGHVLATAKPEDFSTLPVVVGAGADREAQGFLTLLKSYPDIQAKVDSVVRVGDRRWDLHLTPKIIARLPEQDVGTALHRLSVLMSQEKIFDRNIAAIDLRIPDRLIIDPATPPKPTGSPKP
jgi:cell division protein FtsQ